MPPDIAQMALARPAKCQTIRAAGLQLARHCQVTLLPLSLAPYIRARRVQTRPASSVRSGPQRQLKIEKGVFHGEWNHVILPRGKMLQLLRDKP